MAWPARPTRCRKAFTERGEPSWQTRAMSPMSMPSSSELVATSAFSMPDFSRCSASSRCSRARLPWCAVTCASPRRSARWRAARSATRRWLTKISVVRCWRINSASRSYSSPHTSSAITAVSGERGTSIARSRSRTWPASTIATSCAVPSLKSPGDALRSPTRKHAISCSGFTVADRPMRTGGRSHSASSRSSVSARCAPRLTPATACSSSTITVRTDFSMARPDADVSRMYSDSGVVTRMCGGRRRMRSRSAAGVSPVRTASRMATSGSPIATSPARMPASGSCRFLRMSLDSALSGET